jgi:hypothetical protein
MKKRLSPVPFAADPVAQALRSAIDSDCPTFSRHIHARIMSQLVREQVESSGRASFKFPFRRLVPAVMAAALLVAAGLWIWPRAAVPQQSVIGNSGNAVVTPAVIAPRHEMPSLPPITDMIGNTLASANQRLYESRYAYLDRDARNLVGCVMNRFDVAPIH